MTDPTQVPVVDDGDAPAEEPRGRIGRPRRDAGEPSLVSEDFARRLVAQDREEGLDIAGEAGLLGQMVQSVLQAALAEESTDHLGYESGDPAGRGSGNSRNGSTAKTVLTEAGPVELATPRDRAGTFTPQLVRRGQRRLDGIDKIVLGLHAKGMSTHDITAHLAEGYDVEVSPDLISRITDAVHAEVAEWQARPLNPVYPVIFLDALVCQVRDGGTVHNKAAHLAVGVDAEGRKEISGVWVETTEGAKFWLRVINELKARGVFDVLIAVCDGLTGLPEAITAVWPRTRVQTCIVHLIRVSLRWVDYKDRKRVAGLLRPIYSTPTEVAARAELDALADSDFGRDNPGVIRRRRDSWELVIPFFDFARGPQGRSHHQHDRKHQQPATPRHSQPRPLPLRRGPDQGPSPGLQGDGPHQHPSHCRQRQRRPLEDSTQPVRHHVPGPARPGLIHPAVGSLAVQLARRWGAGQVIATASSPEKRALTEELGADATVDPALADDDPEAFTAALREANGGRPVDVVLEIAGGNVFAGSLSALAPFGRLVTYGAAARQETGAVPPGMLLQGSRAVIDLWLAHCMTRPSMLDDAMTELLPLVAEVTLRPVIGGRHPLTAVRGAHQDLLARRTTGKLVLDPAR